MRSDPRDATPAHVSGRIDDLAAFQARIGRTPPAVHLKVIDHIDAGASQWLAAATLMFASFGDADRIAATLGGGDSGFACAIGPRRLRMRADLLDDPAAARSGAGAGLLFLAPGLRETLRVNGRVALVSGDYAEIDVEECFVHCAKAIIRSDFWSAAPRADSPSDAPAFLDAARFVTLATMDANGAADVSPKGDPAGRAIRLADDAVWFAERPGNRRCDSFRNILSQPRVGLVALIPGATVVATLTGVAQLTCDDAIRAGFAVDGKIPTLVTRVADLRIDLRESMALKRARPWPAQAPAGAIDPAQVLSDHVKRNRSQGLHASLARAAVSIPGLMQKGLDRDYKTRLY